MIKQYRQGDVLLVETQDIELDGVRTVPRDHGRIILALGEGTGHAHAISAADAELLEAAEGERFLYVTGLAALTHEEHGAMDLEPGLYRVIRQREYGPGMAGYVRD